MEHGILSLLPTLIAVGLALTTKNVYVSLLLGLLAGNTIVAGGNILHGIDGLIAGTIMKPLNDKYLTSPEKQCYIVHIVSAPVCALIPLSSW